MREIFSSYILPAILIGFISVLGYGAIQKTQEHNELYGEVNTLEDKLKEEKTENEKLRARIDAFKDPGTIDMEARERLGLKKEGEHVVILLPPEEERIETKTEEAPAEEVEKNWWEKVKAFFSGE